MNLERVIAWLEQHPRVARALDRPLFVRPLDRVLTHLAHRQKLDLQLRALGAPGARWWEPVPVLEERVMRAVVDGWVRDARASGEAVYFPLDPDPPKAEA